MAKARKVKATKTKRTKTKTRKAKARTTPKLSTFAGHERLRTHGKDSASVEVPITPAESTKTEPPITGMLIHSDEGGETAALHSGCIRQRNKNLFLTLTIS